MNLSGHEDAWREWRNAQASQRMHHGWILAGKKGLGKAAFAHAAARELVVEPGVEQPPDNHPDIIVLTHLPATADDEAKKADGKPYQVKRSIGISQIREMQQRLVTRPTLGERRAIIVDPADDLEKPAANALLKSLEEPPAGSFFVLVSHRPGRLLATIRSRCRMLRFPELPDDEVDAVLRSRAPQADAPTRAAAIAAASGSPGAALDFVSHDLAPLHGLMQKIAQAGDPGFNLRGELAQTIGQRPDRERLLASLELARAVLASEIHNTDRSRLLRVVDAHDEINRLAGQAPTYNFDPALLVMEIGTLLASVAVDREPGHG
ncbi:DNA polymerase III subunit delta' [Croceicoccus estronivorus]|uniref:DNA polymerase III subunit delta' n=1 Tax=Croceicoccus estronivorus TaxID=1172626 RepID=UPI00082F851C|nr:DNA polymerase III subunit delta' [Croceicoccus estronivorus]OCC24527.1 DNA polymerase III subunit delta' [Croceicoccus estronivorus]